MKQPTRWYFQNFIYVLLVIASIPVAWSQQLKLPGFTATDDPALASAMPTLARQIMEIYTDATQDSYQSNLFRLQMVSGDYSGAHTTLERIRTHQDESEQGASIAWITPDEITVRAKLHQARLGSSFDVAVADSFHEVFQDLNNQEARDAIYWLWGPVQRFRSNVTAAITKSNSTGTIELTEALDLIRNYQLYAEYSALIPLTEALIEEDDSKRYFIQRDVQVKSKNGATLCILVLRSRHVAKPVPTALNFTIYAGLNAMDKARRAAIHGYAGVVANARGKACSSDEIQPWEVESLDTHAIIDWISKQPWSDGQVGMYGGSYEGFTQWAAVKHVHPALKTIVPWASTHPGLVLPMSNNVFQNANYQWAFYVTNNKYLDDAANADQQRWQLLDERSYRSGRPYREIDQVDGTPNRVLQRQLQHPAFDRYWQAMTPYQRDFAHLRIPVLQITGYFDPAQIAAINFLTQHNKFNKSAEHYLVIGPYEHYGAQSSDKPSFVNGYAIDSVAQFNTLDVTYQWFDYIMRGGKKPGMLVDKINYQVMGANIWRHAPSIEAMHNNILKLYLTDTKSGDHYVLSSNKPKQPGATQQNVDFSDRESQNNVYPDGVLLNSINSRNCLSYLSEPFDTAISIDGAIKGMLNVVINRKDMDFSFALYEVTPNGQYFNLSYYLGRASYAKDPTTRRLLVPGRVESIPFSQTPLTSRQLSKGSRLLLLLTINKNRFAQVNYGTGKDVADESITDASVPLQVRWLNKSYITVPISR